MPRRRHWLKTNRKRAATGIRRGVRWLEKTHFARRHPSVIPNIAFALLLAASITMVGPFVFSDEAHDGLNAQVRRLSWVGNQFIGVDIGIARASVFSLVRDLGTPFIVQEHAQVYRSLRLSLMNYFTRGRYYTVADVLKYFNIQLTAKQARSLALCKPLDDLKPGERIIIKPDPWQYGIASWYGPGFDGRRAASGEIYNMYEMTAAHKTLPLQTVVRVVSRATDRSIVVRISDRGPYVAGRNIDLSYAAKQALGMAGLAGVSLEIIDPRALNVSCP